MALIKPLPTCRRPQASKALLMHSLMPPALAVTEPVALGIGVAALLVVFVAFKVARFVMKMILMLAAVAALAVTVW